MIHWTDSELESMGYPSPADLERAAELSRSDKFIALLWLAAIAGITGAVYWDERSLRYTDKQGRAIKWPVVWNALERVRDVSKTRVTALSNQLAAKTINLDLWTLLMRDEIKTMHTLASGIAQGGVAQLSPADLWRTARATKTQYEYLQAFHLQLADGTQLLDGRFYLRTKMYVDASHFTATEMRREQMATAGYDLEQNIMEEGDNCPGCEDATGEGWVEIGSLPAIGERDCLVNCRCDLEYRKSKAA